MSSEDHLSFQTCEPEGGRRHGLPVAVGKLERTSSRGANQEMENIRIILRTRRHRNCPMKTGTASLKRNKNGTTVGFSNIPAGRTPQGWQEGLSRALEDMFTAIYSSAEPPFLTDGKKGHTTTVGHTETADKLCSNYRIHSRSNTSALTRLVIIESGPVRSRQGQGLRPRSRKGLCVSSPQGFLLDHPGLRGNKAAES